MELQFTLHAADVIAERKLEIDWIMRAIKDADFVQDVDDGTRHYFSRIPESEGRVLRVVVNQSVAPPRVVTVLFDRRMKQEVP
jgi:hypothetical protein